MQEVTIYQGEIQPVTETQETKESYAIRLWLASKASISESAKTQAAYLVVVPVWKPQ